jgi:diacylglycerol O-acyltransferase
MTALEPLEPEDLRILRLESPTIAGHTCKVAIFDRVPHAPPLELLRDRVATRIARVPRCRQRLAALPDGGGLAWRSDDIFSIERHVRTVAAPAPVSRRQLLDLVANVMMHRLDRDRPLWAVDVVEALEDGGWAFIWTVHHCIADGMTAMRWARDLFFDDVGLSERPVPPPAAGAVAPRWALAEHVPTAVARELTPRAPRSPFDGRAGAARAVAFAHCSLADMRRIEKATVGGTTINDVLLAAVAGGIRRWLVDRGAPLHNIRVKVPVSMHGSESPGEAHGNRDSFIFVDVPLRESDPLVRLRAVRDETTQRKRRGDPQTMFAMFNALQRVPPLGRLVTRFTMSAHEFTLNVSNVPGPREPQAFSGAPLRELYSLAEIAPHHALRVSAVSLAGSMFVALNSDPEIVPEVDQLAAHIEASIAELSSCAEAIERGRSRAGDDP